MGLHIDIFDAIFTRNFSILELIPFKMINSTFRLLVTNVIRRKYCCSELKHVIPILCEDIVLSGSFLLQILQGERFQKGTFDDIDVFIKDTQWDLVKSHLLHYGYSISNHRETTLCHYTGTLVKKPFFKVGDIRDVYDCRGHNVIIQVILLSGPPIPFIGGDFDFDITRNILTDKKLWICERENLLKKINNARYYSSKTDKRREKYEKRGYRFCKTLEYSKTVVYYRYIFDRRTYSSEFNMKNFQYQNYRLVNGLVEVESKKLLKDTSDIELIEELKQKMLVILGGGVQCLPKRKITNSGFVSLSNNTRIHLSRSFFQQIGGKDLIISLFKFTLQDQR
jgi:hypothetical protein